METIPGRLGAFSSPEANPALTAWPISGSGFL